MFNKLIIFLFLVSLFNLFCHSELLHKPGIIQPKLLFTEEPFLYPVEAFNLGIEGKTIVRIMVDEEGNVSESSILESSGSPILDQAALKMVASSVYEPGTIDGVPGKFELHIPVQFKLDDAHNLIENIDEWLEQTLIYRKEIKTSTNETLRELYKNLFYHYQDLARKIGQTRSKIYNAVILDIVDDSIRRTWSEYEKDWPLGFLLYQDYIDRYPESDYIAYSLNDLIKCLERDKKILEHYTYAKPPYTSIYSLILKELINAYDKKHF